MRAVLVVIALVGVAHADAPCDSLLDPVATPLRDGAIDAQRSACTRSQLFVALVPDVLIDTPGFHGELSGALDVGGSVVVARGLELSARARLARFVFVQNAVNKASEIQNGPLVLGALWSAGGAGIAATLEAPYTRTDVDTTHLAGTVEIVASIGGLHGRFGVVGSRAWSIGGSTGRIAFRAGTDYVRRVGERWSLGAGVELQAGWHDGFDTALVRLGVQRRFGAHYRGQFAVGLPLGGDERSNAVITLGVVRDL